MEGWMDGQVGIILVNVNAGDRAAALKTTQDSGEVHACSEVAMKKSCRVDAR
jgi:hypothetical protein